jgi:hypothetical protein
LPARKPDQLPVEVHLVDMEPCRAPGQRLDLAAVRPPLPDSSGLRQAADEVDDLVQPQLGGAPTLLGRRP